MMTLTGVRCSLLRVACFTFALILVFHAMASAQADKAPPWLDVLKNDKRMQVKMSIDLRPEATVEAWFAAIKKATGVTLTLADPPTTGRIVFTNIIVTEPKHAAWGIMKAGAARDFHDAVWEKTEDGYRLHGKPKRIVTPDQAKAAAEKKKRQYDVWVKAKSEWESLVKKFPLRTDRRLKAKVSVVGANLPLPAVLGPVEKAAGLQLTLADNLRYHEPKLGGFQFRNAPAFALMEAIANIDLDDGHWEKTDEGYRLQGVSRALRSPPRTFPWLWTLASVGGVLVVAGAVVIHRKRAKKPVAVPSKV